MDPKQQYRCTEIFLTSDASKSEVARLGRDCLELAKVESPLTDPEEPWIANEDGVQWKSMAILPLKAATHAHFYLEAMAFEPARFLVWGQLRFQVKCDDRKLKSLLGEIIRLCENLEVNKINDSIENRAVELTSELDKLFAVDLQDFSVEWALEMFCSPQQETRMKSLPSKVVVPTRKDIPSKHLRRFQKWSTFLYRNIPVFLCLFSLFAHIPTYYILWRKWHKLASDIVLKRRIA
ncbi:hypothetical protein BT96DRAFT_974420 [Gymnopus androsaceus JB14]|uniref:Uncharacterized protein n=1 Tax=Gymnopus androsaceus JB14 TaxID=1447944 RepID=A0A6A4HWW7_9AGAR|nr:hypothetical protein BT96DRAFT_974420 [Gymnopus androsaceus JB14]